MADESKSGVSTAVIVALITVLGGLGTAAIANWDKLTGSHSVTAAAGSQAAAQPGSVNPGASGTGAVRGLGAAQSRALGAETSALDQVTAAIDGAPAPQAATPGATVPPAAPGPTDISGGWHDGDGYLYRIEQQGAQYRYGQFRSGTLVGSGGGIMTGRHFAHTFVSSGMSGSCEGEVATDGKALSGACRSGGQMWPMRAERD